MAGNSEFIGGKISYLFLREMSTPRSPPLITITVTDGRVTMTMNSNSTRTIRLVHVGIGAAATNSTTY